MLNILKNESIFPEYIKLNLCSEFVEQLDQLITPFKSEVSDAVIYSIIENKTLKSNRRKSYKKSFVDVTDQNRPIKSLLQANVVPLIYSVLKKEYPNCSYDVSIGDQMFDYIKYENGGYFEKHKDFVRYSNDNHRQYTFLIGLGDICNSTSYYSSGNTILWFPINHLTQYDYDELLLAIGSSNGNCNGNCNSSCNCSGSCNGSCNGNCNGGKQNQLLSNNQLVQNICEKYGIGYVYSSDQLKQLFDINSTETQYMPYVMNINEKGKSLIFRSDIIHSGEPYVSNNGSIKELFMFTVNVVGINKCQSIDESIDESIAEPKSNKYSTSNYDIYNECINDECINDVCTNDKCINADKFTNATIDNNKNKNKINEWLNDSQLNIIMFDQFEYWMLDFCRLYKLFPWQIIVSKGTYNLTNFADTYVRYLNLDIDLPTEFMIKQNIEQKTEQNTEQNIEQKTEQKTKQNILTKINDSFKIIYQETKNKLHKRKRREKHIESQVLHSSIDITNIEKQTNICNFSLDHLSTFNDLSKKLQICKYNILNYYYNFSSTLKETGHMSDMVKYKEKVINTWEESSCNDDGDEYDETTYLSCNIDIKFCFCKI